MLSAIHSTNKYNAFSSFSMISGQLISPKPPLSVYASVLPSVVRASRYYFLLVSSRNSSLSEETIES
ncbi:MAG: hypothetical protein ABIE23_00770 [archaeon]